MRTAGVVMALWVAGCVFDPTGAALGGGDDTGIDAAVASIDGAAPPRPDASRSDAAPAPDAAPPDATDTDTDTVELVVLTTSIDQGRLGNLTIKLTSPDGTTLGVISRPGFYEDADDGSDAGTPDQYDASGDQSDFHAGYPITFRDDSVHDAEQMGHDLFGVGTAVCEDDAICDYFPNPGAVAGPTSFAEAFNGQTRIGAWRLCVADSNADTNPAGELQGWALDILTPAGVVSYEATSLGLVIPDAAYDGTLPSMICHTIIVDP